MEANPKSTLAAGAADPPTTAKRVSLESTLAPSLPAPRRVDVGPRAAAPLPPRAVPPPGLAVLSALDRSVPEGPSPTDLLSIVRLLPDVVFRCVKDEHGTIRWTLNEGRLAEEFHVTTKDVYGKSLAEMFPPDVAARTAPHFEAAFRGEAHTWVHELGGRQFKHFPQPVIGPDGKVEAVVGFITDVTDLVRAEEQAKMLNGELLRRLVELREANLGLEQANRDLDGFAAAASHDLRNPLAVIATTVRTMQLRAEGTESERHFARIHAAVQRMDELIADLLRFSRATQQAYQPEPMDLSSLAEDVARELQAQEPARKVQWSIQQGIHVHADPGILRVALENLIGNAWKYTGKSAHPHVTVRSEGPDSLGRPVIAILDNGVGFKAAEAGRLFQAFQRLSTSQGYPGTGMGLATVRRIVERHGGRIWAESGAEGGATFRFTLAAAT